MPKRILVPTDGSEITVRAVETAIEEALAHGGELFAIAVKQPYPFSEVALMHSRPSPKEWDEAQQRIADDRVQAVVDAAHAAGLSASGFTIEHEHPWQAIIDHAKAEDANLIVMASHGRRGLAGMVLGSETLRVLMHTKLPVLVVR